MAPTCSGAITSTRARKNHDCVVCAPPAKSGLAGLITAPRDVLVFLGAPGGW